MTGGNANHTVADPTNEASTGMRDRNAVNPLQQLKAFSGNPGAFTFVPANDPTGLPVSPAVLSTSPDASGLGGLMLSIDGGAPTKDTTPIDHTAVNGNQLAPNHTYTWSGYLYVPADRHIRFCHPTERHAAHDAQLPADGPVRKHRDDARPDAVLAVYDGQLHRRPTSCPTPCRLVSTARRGT